jgi:Tfp pilus assembly protein PilO
MNVIDILLRQKPLIKVLIIVVILAAILGTYWQVFYKPVLTDIRTIEPELNQLKSELAAKKVIVKEKARYLAELEQTGKCLLPRHSSGVAVQAFQALTRGCQKLFC